MKEPKSVLQNRLQYLQEIRSKTKSELENAPEGILRISGSKERVQYYCRIKGNERKDVYLPKTNSGLARELAQKEYFLCLDEAAEKEMKLLQECLNRYPAQSVETIYPSLSGKRKDLVNPLIDTDEIFLQKWLSQPYTGKVITGDAPELLTDRGELVRSKSELIIANTLAKMNIPYKYECPLSLAQIGQVYPDFTILDILRRKEIYWEHLGMMDNPEYAGNAVRKIRYYNMSGYYEGDQLIVTMETRDNPINLRQIHGILDHILRPLL